VQHWIATLMFKVSPIRNWSIRYNIYRVISAQADWASNLQSATSCERAAPLAEKNAAARPELLAHIIYFFL
jgi:hypothetical protein